ncbi:uncharacterized protein si:dkey-27h10.2 isoform X3 [Micropterus dolomieu]|uniref:uncharacterized protein si:dkey-27h10.2 isoform X3 n=1 Tax=Micropterus dolomieu TaxID=147949 RepID=UPI001E8DEC02|nr:uncharacterized protein si:dkey-27h10.2 isoform X3 [Micropterus dolomieu]
MHSIRPFFFVLGLVVASVAANHTLPEVSEKVNNSNVVNDSNGNSTITTTVTPFTTNYQTNTFTMTSISSTASTMNITKTNSTVTPPITKQNSSQDDKATQSTRSAMSETTPKPYPSTIPQERTSNRAATATMPKAAAGDKAGIIILVVILLIALGFGVACYFARKRDRRYSVDLTSRPDEAHIPLSTMDPEMPVNTGPQNGLQTFVDTETTKNEPQEPEAKPEVQEEQKPEADKSVVDPSAESAAPAPSPDSPEDKPKEDAAEQSPPAPVKPSVEEKTDDEGVVSTKTSIESLKEINENNSNNADVSQKRDLTSSNLFWDIPLDCPV